MSITSHALLAATRVDELSTPYRAPVIAEEAASIFWWMLIPFVAAAVGLVILHGFRRRMHTVETPNDLLRELCYAHRINATGRNLMMVVAESASLETPASMFLTMKKYDAAVQSASKSVTFDRHDQETLKMLRRQLFSMSP